MAYPFYGFLLFFTGLGTHRIRRLLHSGNPQHSIISLLALKPSNMTYEEAAAGVASGAYVALIVLSLFFAPYQLNREQNQATFCA
jgi:hypothetical protein